MRTERFNSTLLSTLLIVSLIAPAITLLSVSLASANPGLENIIQGDPNAYNANLTGTPPWKPYKTGDFPPIMAAKEIGSGAVVASGLGRTTNGGPAYGPNRWTPGELDVLFDNAFQWMVPGAENVLWYGEYIDELEGTYEYAFNNASTSSNLVDTLKAKGYTVDNTIDGTETEITPDLLAGYDILVTPGLQVGDGATGGDPTQLDDNVVGFIKDFVEGGKGLFIMDVADWDGYNFYKVQNKILTGLDFGLYFQPDTILNDTEPDPRQFNADVMDVDFGTDYRNATAKTTIRVYKVCSLAPELENYAVSVEILPSYIEGLAGGTLEYEVKVTNVGKITDNYTLENSDSAGWDLTISPSVLELENNFVPKYATLSVTIPPGTSIGTVNNVTVTATSEDNTDVSSSSVCLAIVENRVRPSKADAQVVEAEPDDNYGERMFMYVGSSATGEFLNERVFVKFDLKALGTADVDNVRLYLYCFAINGMPDSTVRLHRVDSPWVENEINWGNQPTPGAVLTDETVVDTDRWYSWDVTSYVNNQRDNDNLASFALSYVTASETYPDNWSYGFSTKESSENFAHPYLAVWTSVSTVVRSRYKEGLPGGELKYTVIVQNTGALHDTYTLENSDNAGWDLTISPDSLVLPPGESGTATVTVKIPLDAPIGENIDNINVIATSTVDPTVSDDYWFVANVSDTNIGPPEDDSTVKQAEPIGNWVLGVSDEDGEPAKIEVGREYGGPERGFLKFDLQAIPSLDNIARARLWLNAEGVDDVGAVVRVHSTDDSWIERGAGRLMWGNQPSIGENLDVRAVVEADKQYFWDVTDFVRQEFQSDNEASFALVDLGENIPPNLHAASFTSKESEIMENHPYLEILTTEPTREVRAYISPVFQGGVGVGTTLTYTVTVKNTGTLADTYDLDNSDTEGWGLSISPSTLSLAAGESDNATLSVTILSGTVCTLDKITVTATSQAVGSVKDSAVAFAHLSKSDFGLENLYKISIDPNLRLREDADNLVAKFKNYSDQYEGESVVYSGILPWHLTGSLDVPHPLGDGTKKVDLVLVDETGTVLATVDTFTVDRNVLFGRLTAIYLVWPFADAGLRNVLFAEISDIYLQWPFAP